MAAVTSSQGDSSIVNAPADDDLLKKAFDLLSNRRVRQSDADFSISKEVIDHADIEDYMELLTEQYENAGVDVVNWIKQSQYTDENQPQLKSFITGTKNELSVLFIGTVRQRDDVNDEHKVLTITMKKSLEMSAIRTCLVQHFNMKSAEQKQLEEVLSKLTEDDNKKLIELMLLRIFGDEIREFLGAKTTITPANISSNEIPTTDTPSSSENHD